MTAVDELIKMLLGCVLILLLICICVAVTLIGYGWIAL